MKKVKVGRHKKFKPILVTPFMRKYVFENGYGASVINTGYGSERGLLEIGLTDARGKFLYGKERPQIEEFKYDNVVGWLNEEGVQKLLEKISKLPNRIIDVLYRDETKDALDKEALKKLAVITEELSKKKK